MNAREEETFKLSKLERIFYLDRLGFNTPVFIEKISDLSNLTSFYDKKKGNKVSIRTQGKDVLGPHFPNIKLDKIIFKQLCSTLRKGYELLIFEPINPLKALQRGTIWIDRKLERVTVEYSELPGTVREMELMNRKEISILEKPFNELLRRSEGKYSFIGYPFSKYLEIPLNSFIIEFSKMPRPVGRKKMNYIFWEIRYGG